MLIPALGACDGDFCVRLGETAASVDFGGGRKYSNENFVFTPSCDLPKCA